MKIKIALAATVVPLLHIGDDGRTLSEEFCKRGAQETQWIRGKIIFADGSFIDGERRISFDVSEYRANGNSVDAIGFQAYEYFAPKETES